MENKVKIIFVTMVVLALVGFGRTTVATTEEVVDEAFFFVTTGYSEREQADATVYGRAYAIEDSSNRKVVVNAAVYGLRNASNTNEKEGKIFITSPGWRITKATCEAFGGIRSLDVYHYYGDHPTNLREGVRKTLRERDAADFETAILDKGSYSASITIEPRDLDNPPDECTIVILVTSSRISRTYASNDYYCIIESDHATVRF